MKKIRSNGGPRPGDEADSRVGSELDGSPTGRSRNPKRIGFFGVLILAASAVFIGFGVQQYTYQLAAEERDRCYAAWGEKMVDTVTTRVSATTKVQRAAEARNDAVDSIVLVYIGLRQDPPAKQEKDLDSVLTQFAGAKSRLDVVAEKAQRTRVTNPYPELDC